MKTVVVGFLGPTLDQGFGKDRWARWRPTVALCQQEDLLIHRLELIYQKKFTNLAQRLVEDIKQISPETEVRLHDVPLEDAWDLELTYGAMLDWARRYRFSDRERYLLHITTGTHIAQICWFLLAESHRIPAQLIQTSPMKNAPYTIIDLDLSKYDRLASRFRVEQTEAVSFLKSGIQTKNAAFNRLIERIEKVAMASKDPLLLMGPTGSGKSQLAKRIFELKKARQQVRGEFVEVNCATLRGDAAMSALFGHTRGAYTGATEARGGLLKKAHEGVLFLDEIGELGADEQAMLLRAIEEKIFYPVGGDKVVSADFQLIAGTNRDLKAPFRDDLLARINTWTFKLPALRERPEDLAPNLDYELERLGASFNKEARERFLDFAVRAPWPGNFRDFSAAVRRMATLAGSARISVADVDEELARLRDPLTEKDTLDRFDRVQLDDVLEVCRTSASLSEAGRRLFAVSLSQKSAKNDADRLRKYLARFGLDWASARA